MKLFWAREPADRRSGASCFKVSGFHIKVGARQWNSVFVHGVSRRLMTLVVPCQFWSILILISSLFSESFVGFVDAGGFLLKSRVIGRQPISFSPFCLKSISIQPCSQGFSFVK